MRTFEAGPIGRTFVIAFERGDYLLEGINEQIEKNGIRNGVVVSGIGTFDKAIFHRVTTTDEVAVEDFIEIDEPMELSAVQGVIADGFPHLHMVFSDLEKTYSGHLEPGCRILYLAEVVIQEFPEVNFYREKVGYNKVLALLPDDK